MRRHRLGVMFGLIAVVAAACGQSATTTAPASRPRAPRRAHRPASPPRAPAALPLCPVARSPSGPPRTTPTGSRRRRRSSTPSPQDRHQGRARRDRRGPVQAQITAASAAGTLPDVSARCRSAFTHPRGRRAGRHRGHAAVVDTLGTRHVLAARPRARPRDGQLVACRATAGPSCWSTARTCSTRPGCAAPTTYDTSCAAAKTLDSADVAGFVAATGPATRSPQQTFEDIALGQRLPARSTTAATSPSTASSASTAFDFYRDLSRTTRSPAPRTSTPRGRRTSPARRAMIIWSTFILDEMAGLRNDALPTCPQCKTDPPFLAKNSGMVTAIQGPPAAAPASSARSPRGRSARTPTRPRPSSSSST